LQNVSAGSSQHQDTLLKSDSRSLRPYTSGYFFKVIVLIYSYLFDYSHLLDN